MTATNKKAFDFSRNTMYMCDPVDDLCIIGGADTLPFDESGTLDTKRDDEHVLWDLRLLVALDEPFVLNIDAFGVIEPVVIAKIDDLACVVEGRRRVRAARIVNRRRAKRGEPPMKVACVVRRTNDTDLMGVMIAGNEARMDDDIATKISKLKRYMARGVGIEDCATTFNMPVSTIKAWMQFDDTAIASVKQAVDIGQLSMSAGIEVARTIDPVKQQAALDEIKKTGATSARGARSAAKRVTRPEKREAVVDKRTQRKLLEAVEKLAHKNAGEKTLAWWQGVEDALKLVTGDGDVDDRLTKMLSEVQS